MLEDEAYACGGSGILLASDLVGYAFSSIRCSVQVLISSHLMITYPTTSNALESFVLDRAEESTHSAMLVGLLVFGVGTC